MDASVRTRLSVMMFLEYFIWGAWSVAIFKFMGRRPTEGGLAFPAELQGWVDATLAIGAMISPIFVGLFADRLFATEKVLAILHLAGALLLAWAAIHCTESLAEIRSVYANPGPTVHSVAEPPPSTRTAGGRSNPELQECVSRAGWRLFWIMLAYALCYMPTLTLTNSISFRNLADPDRHFGSIRVLGTIGWIVAGVLVGLALNEVSVQPLWLAAGASLALGLGCLALPHTPPAGGTATLADALGLPALRLLRDRSFLAFLVCSLLVSVLLKFYYQQGNTFFTDIHMPYPAALMGILGQGSEIVFMLLIPVGLSRLGTKGMLLVGMLAWCLRYAIFALKSLPAVIGLGLPLHGICYDFFFVVAYLYVDRRAPSQLRASAQGLITFATLGVGMFLGSLLTGTVVQQFSRGDLRDWSRIWLVPLAGVGRRYSPICGVVPRAQSSLVGGSGRGHSKAWSPWNRRTAAVRNGMIDRRMPAPAPAGRDGASLSQPPRHDMPSNKLFREAGPA